jgi:hypothetical protein
VIVTILLSFVVLAARVTVHSLFPGHVPIGGPPVWSLFWWEFRAVHPIVIPVNVVVWPAATFVGELIARKAAASALAQPAG